MEKHDFSGWATRYDIKCSDGLTIRHNAFADCDGQTVPLVWNHMHQDVSNVLGHALLESRPEGVYAYCSFNDTENGQHAKEMVKHGDVESLSIYANRLKKNRNDVMHGVIRELSLVLAGANIGALIDNVIRHGEESEDELIIYTDKQPLELYHTEAPAKADPDEKKEEKPVAEEPKKKPESEETVQDVFDTLNEKQKTVVYALIGQALEDAGEGEEDDDNKGGKDVKHNMFDKDTQEQDEVLSHAEIQSIFTDARRGGSLRDTVLAHGIEHIDYLFPDAKTLTRQPEFIKRDTSWVSEFMGSVHRSPFSRIKSIFANITEADARARGYIKGNLKIEEIFGLLKRETQPTTVYKKQALNRDDVVDITDFDAVAFVKSEMRVMLDEELARAAIFGDGRSAASDDKINEQNIRPIWTDDDLFTIKTLVTLAANATDDVKAKALIRACVKSRKDYKGSGRPTCYTTEDWLTNMLLMEDTTGRVIYDTEEKLATAMRVKKIVTVPVMENLTRTVSGTTRTLAALIVNPDDYNFGADKGGAVNLFDDFDIDYNQMKYLMETRCSGALTKPYSAIAIETAVAAG